MADRENVEDARSRLRRFQAEHFNRFEAEFRELVERGQDPHALFIGCSDSRVVPHLLLGAEPGTCSSMRNVGASSRRRTAGRTRPARRSSTRCSPACGTSSSARTRIAARWRRSTTSRRPARTHLNGWLEHAREAGSRWNRPEDVLRRTEQRMVVIGIERLMGYPWWPRRSRAASLALHDWH